MAVHETRLDRREEIAEGTMAFWFERPGGFHYRAGQRVLVSLLDMTGFDGFGSQRTFTLASAPHEPELMIATRMRDTAFKRTLRDGRPGLRASLDGPHGEMTLHRDSNRAAVWMAGGIGVTPFLSIARDAAHERLPHRLLLFYSNRRPEDAPFLDELRGLEKANPNFRVVPTMTDLERSRRPWGGETGPIGEAMLRRHLGALRTARPVYYLAGPPGMVLGMQQLLDSLGVPEADVRTEEFYGY
jgi:ferredoxin-NADP reductase